MNYFPPTIESVRSDMSRVLLLFATVVFPWFVLSGNDLVAQEAIAKKPAAQEKSDLSLIHI